jgi:hypothetical protein
MTTFTTRVAAMNMLTGVSLPWPPPSSAADSPSPSLSDAAVAGEAASGATAGWPAWTVAAASVGAPAGVPAPVVGAAAVAAS